MAIAWIPILGGILFTVGIMGVLVLLAGWKTPIYDFGEEDEEEEEGGVVLVHGYDLDKLAVDDPFLFQLITYLDGLNIYQLHLFAKMLEERLLGLKGGGMIAEFGRDESIKPLRFAQTTNSRALAIENILNAMTGFRSVMELTIFLEFFLDLALDLFGANPFGYLNLLKWAASLRKLDKLVDRIEQIQLIKSKVDRYQQIKKLKEDLDKAGGNIIKLNDAPVSQAEGSGESTASVADYVQGYLVQPAVSLKGFSPIVMIFSVVGLIGILLIGFYGLFGGFNRPIDTIKGTPVADVSQGGELAGDESEIDLAAPTETPFPTPTLSPLDFVLMFGNFTEEQKAQIALAYLLDPEGDWIYSISTQIVLQQLAQVDITGYLAVWLRLNEWAAGNWFNNSYFPCNQEIPGGLVVCPESAGDMPEGRLLMLVMQLAEAVPLADSERFYTYAAVMDADGNPANNFQYNAPYDWDYWQNTDQWYILDWVPPEQSWSVSVLGENWEPLESNARVVIFEDVVVFFIPAGEFTTENPAFRMSAFGHDGSYQPDVSSGDVTGANPSEALLEPIAEEVLIEE